MPLRRVAIVLAVAVGFIAPLVIAGSAESATSTGTASTVSRATAGQVITFTGKVSGGARKVIVYRIWQGAEQTPIVGTSNSSGVYSISRRMMAMPIEYYQVVAPASGSWTAWKSSKIAVTDLIRDVSLTLKNSTFTAQVNNHTMNIDGSDPTTPVGVAGRKVELQQRASNGSWTVVAGPSATDNGGNARFTLKPAADGVYRALSLQTANGISAYPSFPVRVTSPSLGSASVSDPAGRALSPMPDSGNGAAQKYNWWPNNSGAFWDMEQGEGLVADGCTSNCDRWTDYATGSGRVTITDGQIALDSGYPDKTKPIWGNLSSTMQIGGWTNGRWEMRVHSSEYVCPATCSPNDMAGRSPYVTQISLVPAGTPDSVVTPTKQIVLAQWKGYNGNVLLAYHQGSGKKVLTHTVSGVQWNRADWNDVAVQINGTRIVWLIDGKVVGQAPGGATVGVKWVPRIQMISASGKWMDRQRSGIDWVRYFGMNRPHAKLLPNGPVLK